MTRRGWTRADLEQRAANRGRGDSMAGLLPKPGYRTPEIRAAYMEAWTAEWRRQGFPDNWRFAEFIAIPALRYTDKNRRVAHAMPGDVVSMTKPDLWDSIRSGLVTVRPLDD